MNGSVVTAKMAWMESTANTRSIASTVSSTNSRGVARRRPASRTTKRVPR